MVSGSLSDFGLVFFGRFDFVLGSGFRFFADFRDFSSLGRFFDDTASLTDALVLNIKLRLFTKLQKLTAHFQFV